MKYEGSLYRPPSEARSLIIQATIGCSHNKCTFCSMYKHKSFRIKPQEELLHEVIDEAFKYKEVKRIFIADGDALILPYDYLAALLKAIQKYYPSCQRVTSYATAKSIRSKSLSELLSLKELGLSMVYLGLETGNDQILTNICKGETSHQMIEASNKLKEANIQLSVTVLSGIGGKRMMNEHALDTAKVLNAMQPSYIGLLSLILQEETKLYEAYKKGEFLKLSPKEHLIETRLLLENLKLNSSIFRSNHASNYVSLSGTLNEDKERLIQLIDNYLKEDKRLIDKYRRL